MLPKFLPFKGKYVSVGAVWRHNAPQEATRATVLSSRPHTMQDAVIPLMVPLEAATGPLQTRLGQSPQINWRLPTTPRSFTTMDYGSVLTSTVWGAQTPKSNKIRKGLVGESNFSWWKCRSRPSQPIPRKSTSLIG